MVKAFCLGRPYHFKSLKGCLPQIVLGPFLNTLTHIKAFLQKISMTFPDVTGGCKTKYYLPSELSKKNPSYEQFVVNNRSNFAVVNI